MVADLFLYSGSQIFCYDYTKEIFTDCGNRDDGIAGGGCREFCVTKGDAVGYLAIGDCRVYLPSCPGEWGDCDDEAGRGE